MTPPNEARAPWWRRRALLLWSLLPAVLVLTGMGGFALGGLLVSSQAPSVVAGHDHGAASPGHGASPEKEEHSGHDMAGHDMAGHDMPGKEHADHDAGGSAPQDHDAGGHGTGHAQEPVGPRPVAATVGVFGAVNAGVLLAALVWRRHLASRTRAVRPRPAPAAA